MSTPYRAAKIRLGRPFQVGLGVAGPRPVSWQIPGDHVVAIPGEGPGHLPEGPGALPGPVDEHKDLLVDVLRSARRLLFVAAGPLRPAPSRRRDWPGHQHRLIFDGHAFSFGCAVVLRVPRRAFGGLLI